MTGRARSTVSVAGPGHPCLACAGQWTGTDFEEALTGKAVDNYVDEGDDEGREDDESSREPSAMPTNLFTMGLACQRFLHLVQGLAPGIGVGKATVRLRSWSVEWEQKDRYDKLETCRDSCNRPAVGSGDDSDLKRGPDRTLREERRLPGIE